MLENHSEKAISVESWAENVKGNFTERKLNGLRIKRSSHLEKPKAFNNEI